MWRRPRRLTRALFAGACVAGVLFAAHLTTPVRAHGPAPAVLEVLAVDDEGPSWLRTSIGFAHRRADGAFSFVCPSRWDGNEGARGAVFHSDSDSVLLFSRGVAFLSLNGGCSFNEILFDEAVRDVVPTDDGFVALVGDSLVDIDPLGRVGTREVQPGAVDDIVFAGELVIASRQGEVAWVRQGAREWSLGEGVDRVRLRRVRTRTAEGPPIEGIVQRGSTQELFALQDDGSVRPGPAGEIVLGPLRVDGRGYASVDGTLFVDEGGEWRMDSEVAWTCLQDGALGQFVCTLDGLFEVGAGTASGVESEARFRFVQMGPPECTTSAQCDLDWAHFGGESGWLESAPARDPEGVRRAMGGCHIGAESKVFWWGGLAMLLIVRRPGNKRR